MRLRRWGLAALLLAVAGETALLGYLLARSRWQRQAGGTPVERGRAVAERMGCFGCHGPGGEIGTPNPGAKAEAVPEWSGGTWMMYNDDEADVRAWILDGHPPGHEPDPGALLRMPAFRRHLTEAETADLVAYVLAVSQFGGPDDPVAIAGQQAAGRLGCFGCHGPEGRGVVANPGSFKGYVPPWDGPDFAELVRDEAEFRQWVRNGVSDRFQANPAARRFLATQALPMPAYGAKVTDAEVEALWDYAQWVRANPRGGRPAPS